YPNPARGVIHIRAARINRIVIRNLSGEIIRIMENPGLSAGEIRLPVGDYHPGIYIVEGEGARQYYRRRVIIL
ncbi:MAG: T9SS type A sorting domain-containing protein, partial [Bacteroidales bacterium]|nr:T9SS type A sorting domain-containing protein [Bacteroidales bacterium]